MYDLIICHCWNKHFTTIFTTVIWVNKSAAFNINGLNHVPLRLCLTFTFMKIPTAYGQHSGTASNAAPSQHQGGLNLPRVLSLWSLHFLLVTPWVSSACFGFLPHPTIGLWINLPLWIVPSRSGVARKWNNIEQLWMGDSVNDVDSLGRRVCFHAKSFKQFNQSICIEDGPCTVNRHPRKHLKYQLRTICMMLFSSTASNGFK